MKRLTEKHPTSIKLQKIVDLMEELGITIAVTRYGEYYISDVEWPGKHMALKDIDDSQDITQFPPHFAEYKIIIDG